jgi:hypothetical protein
MKPLIPPVVNLNGNSRADLIEQNMEVSKAARALLESLMRASPHGRNYPALGFNQAREAHFERSYVVSQIEEEYLQMALAIHKGEDK